MGKELAEAAEAVFEQIPGATIEHKDGLLVCTATPQQISAYIENNPLLKALESAVVDIFPADHWEERLHKALRWMPAEPRITLILFVRRVLMRIDQWTLWRLRCEDCNRRARYRTLLGYPFCSKHFLAFYTKQD